MWCVKRFIYVKKIFWNPATCNCENGKYLASIIDDSVITCDEVIDSYDEEINFNEKNITCKTQNFYILLVLLLITITLLIAVSISDKTSSKTKTFITISWHKIKIILCW